jgi:hypothetical protein
VEGVGRGENPPPRCDGGAALQDQAPEQAGRERGVEVQGQAGGAGRLPEGGDQGGVPAEYGDVVPDPGEGQSLVPQARVTRYLTGGRREGRGACSVPRLRKPRGPRR